MQTIYLDISNKGVYPCIYAKQGDVNRKFLLVVTDGGVSFDCEDKAISVWYDGDSGEGNYTHIGEKNAISVTGNKITVSLIQQMLVNAGDGVLSVSVSDASGSQIGLWNIDYCVEERPGAESEEAKKYYDAFSQTAADLALAAKTFTPDKNLSKSGSPADAAETGRQISVERARINQLTALTEGNTTGDAELMDIRVGYDGKEYDTAGNAVRGQVSELKSDLGDLNGRHNYRIEKSGSGWVYVEIDTIPQGSSGIIKYSNLTSGIGIAIELSDANQTKVVELSFTDGKAIFSDLSKDVAYARVYSNGKCNFDLSIYHNGRVDKLEKKDKEIDNNIADINNKLETIDSLYYSKPNDAIKGIIKLYLHENKYHPVANYSKYRISHFYYKSAFYLFIELQGYNGTEWKVIDAVNIALDDAPTETIVMQATSERNWFSIVYIPSMFKTGTYRNVNAEIKQTAIDFKAVETETEIKNIKKAFDIIDFSVKSQQELTNYIDVAKDGSGDFTTIADAYASITDSSFYNQYDIRVHEGVYYETNLVPPPYTHTHGLHPNTVTVSAVGIADAENSVFDLVNTCRLSNMTIISHENVRYSIHFDAGIGSRSCFVENVYCKKVYEATAESPCGVDVRNKGWLSYHSNNVIGMGTGGKCQYIQYKNCIFENGYISTHTNASEDANPDVKISFDGCQFVNAEMNVQKAGDYHTKGMYVCDISNTVTKKGNTTIVVRFKGTDRPWTVTGRNNKNLCVDFSDSNGGSAKAWESIMTTEKGYIQLASGVSAISGQWIDIDGNICTDSTPKDKVFGMALNDSSLDNRMAIPCWIGNAIKIANQIEGTEYGFDSNGYLIASSINKIGKVIGGIFYRY